MSHKHHNLIAIPTSKAPNLTHTVSNLYSSDVTKGGKAKTVMNVFLPMGAMQCMEIVKTNLSSVFVKMDGLDLIVIALNVQQVTFCYVKITKTYEVVFLLFEF